MERKLDKISPEHSGAAMPLQSMMMPDFHGEVSFKLFTEMSPS